jgi:hypothetical protein
LFITGYAQDIFDDASPRSHLADLPQKPISQAQLATRVRSILIDRFEIDNCSEKSLFNERAVLRCRAAFGGHDIHIEMAEVSCTAVKGGHEVELDGQGFVHKQDGEIADHWIFNRKADEIYSWLNNGTNSTLPILGSSDRFTGGVALFPSGPGPCLEFRKIRDIGNVRARYARPTP